VTAKVALKALDPRVTRNGIAYYRSGERYYANRVVAVLVANDNNAGAASRPRQLQFCPGSVPCQAPVGRAAFRQPRVGPVT